ncbi:hypothetical protein RclHR1_02270019 [Rhizophagus clarus]|uniref:Rhodanese-like domain-containing protein n=1 Tax=Rhizophagus clarus TaxID=94130 RepID=A0A2Z6QWR7_9GLOM|nr:hypothetical protein RclHR1_02270019 [Rhizophagus clarus]GET01753.1 rhodanese-like domain-containing protein [Rhizophagus clarus]
MSKLLLQNRARNSLINLLRSFNYKLKSTYNFQNKILSYNKSFSTTFVSIKNDVRNVSHLRYYSDSSSPFSRNNNVSFDELQQLLNEKNKGNQKNVCIVDVREPTELIGGHIPYAINIPLNEFEEALTLSDEDFNKIYGSQKFNKDDQVILYCKAGQRSMVAAAIAKHHGFIRARNYPGSWLEFSERVEQIND